MQTQPKGAETSGFLYNDGNALGVGGDSRSVDGHTGSIIDVFSSNKMIQATPFSAGKGWIGGCQTVLYFLFFTVTMFMTGIIAIQKLFDEDDVYGKSATGCTAGTLSGDALKDSTTCCADSSNGYACHKYFNFEEHVTAAFTLLAVLPWIAWVVGLLYYGCWWKPMTSLGGFNAIVLTVYYAHLIIIVLCCAVVYYWMSEADGYNYTMHADTAGVVSKIPAGVNHGRTNAVKDNRHDDFFAACFFLNAIVLAGAIAFPLTGLALLADPDDDFETPLYIKEGEEYRMKRANFNGYKIGRKP